MSRTRTGFVYAVGAYACWGLFPLYWKLLRPATALEILAHRVIWSFVLVAMIVTTMTWYARRSPGVHGWRRIGSLLRRPRTLGAVALAAALISVNWGTYIYGVNTDRVVETSLGYFMNPLVTVVLGVVVLRERLRAWQWAAIGVGAAAVVVLTAAYGHVPYLSLVLALSFGMYGLIKKRLAVPATDGLLLESAALVLPAAAYALVLAGRGENTFGADPGHTILMVLGGVVTAAPLLLFAGAANRIPLSAIGLLQYLAPIMQLGLGVFVYHEAMPPARLVGFALVWLALAVFTWDGLRSRRVRARATSPAVAPARARPAQGAATAAHPGHS